MKALTSTVTSKGQITIPAEVRYLLGIESGDKIVFIPSKNGFLINKAEKFKPCPCCKGTGKVNKE